MLVINYYRQIFWLNFSHFEGNKRGEVFGGTKATTDCILQRQNCLDKLKNRRCSKTKIFGEDSYNK